MVLEVGIFGPNFKLQGSDGKTHTRKEFDGRYLVLYFYPKDDTPGCTIEAKEFTKHADEIRRHGAEVVGVSKDDLESHSKFMNKCGLGILLLSDPSHLTIQAYDSWGNRGIFGFGTLRKTYIMDPTGKIVKIYDKVNPGKHAAEVIEFLRSVQVATQV